MPLDSRGKGVKIYPCSWNVKQFVDPSRSLINRAQAGWDAMSPPQIHLSLIWKVSWEGREENSIYLKLPSLR